MAWRLDIGVRSPLDERRLGRIDLLCWWWYTHRRYRLGRPLQRRSDPLSRSLYALWRIDQGLRLRCQWHEQLWRRLRGARLCAPLDRSVSRKLPRKYWAPNGVSGERVRLCRRGQPGGHGAGHAVRLRPERRDQLRFGHLAAGLPDQRWP